MINFTHTTTLGFNNSAERYWWVGYHVFLLISTIIGDSLILRASFQKEAFKLNKLIVAIIQHITVIDLAHTIFCVIPTAASLIGDSWFLGDTICCITSYLGYLSNSSGMSLIAVLTTCKWLLLKYPNPSSNWTKKMSHQACYAVLIPPAITTFIMLAVDKDDVAFGYRTYSCNYGFTSSIYKRILPSISTINVIVPNIIIVATTIAILKYIVAAKISTSRERAQRVHIVLPRNVLLGLLPHSSYHNLNPDLDPIPTWAQGSVTRRPGARRQLLSRGSISQEGALTVALIAVIYCGSKLPMFAYNISKRYVNKDPAGLFHHTFYRIAFFVGMLSRMSNIYICTLTISSFRRFLVSKLFPVAPISLLTSRTAASLSTGYLTNITLENIHVSISKAFYFVR